MATGTKAPASRTLNYALTGDVMDRVQQAGKEIRPKENVAEVIQDVGQDVFEVGKEKQEFEQLSGVAWTQRLMPKVKEVIGLLQNYTISFKSLKPSLKKST